MHTQRDSGLASLTGLHGKYATRLLRGGGSSARHDSRLQQRRVYDDAVREALVVLWEASGRVCGKRLRQLFPILLEAMERHGHLQLASDVRSGFAFDEHRDDRSRLANGQRAFGRTATPALATVGSGQALSGGCFNDVVHSAGAYVSTGGWADHILAHGRPGRFWVLFWRRPLHPAKALAK